MEPNERCDELATTAADGSNLISTPALTRATCNSVFAQLYIPTRYTHPVDQTMQGGRMLRIATIGTSMITDDFIQVLESCVPVTRLTFKWMRCLLPGYFVQLRIAKVNTKTRQLSSAPRFWFSLFHELGHIVLGHIGKTDEITEQDENEADLWAKDELIPKEEFEQFKKTQDYSSISVCDFANKIGIAPGIVVGRLQKERCITYNMLNELKEQYEIAM